MGSRAIPAHTMPQDVQWQSAANRRSTAPTASMYSEDFDHLYRDSNLPSVQPLRVAKIPPPSDHAHPHQQIHDLGQKTRTSRLPLFNQVRSMLHKPPPAAGRAVNVKWDEYSGEISAHGKAPYVKPSTYKSPYDGTFETPQLRSTDRMARLRSTSSLSPVSTLREDELDALASAPNVTSHTGPPPDSPVSSASISPVDDELTYRIPLRSPEPPATPSPPPIKVIKRKPAPAVIATVPTETPSPKQSPAEASDRFPPETNSHSPNPKSRFSWTTYAPSLAPTFPSSDNNSSYGRAYRDSGPHSRFSWSTWNTGNTPQLRPDSPPPSPPPPLPRKYANPPVLSILSRARPIQRADREERALALQPPPPSPPPPPPPPSSSKYAPQIRKPTPNKVQLGKTVAVTPTPASAKSERNATTPRSVPSGGGAKKLPLPPELQSPSVEMSHLETLLHQQQDLEHQRRNIEKLIFENSKNQMTSPLQLSFADYRDTQRRLAEHKAMLAEIQLEEREIGVAITRARRKEGEEEGLWVRRVTS